MKLIYNLLTVVISAAITLQAHGQDVEPDLPNLPLVKAVINSEIELDTSELSRQLGVIESTIQQATPVIASLPVWNISDSPGGIVNYDITDALEWSLKNKSRDHIIVIPPSRIVGARERWKISRTIEIPRQYGGWIWFVGQSSNAHYTGLHCSIEWAGPADAKCMFLYSSTDWKFSGKPKFYGAKTCKVGFLTTKQGSYNAGRMTWDGASWYDFTDAAVQIGRIVNEASNECNNWGHQSFHDTPVGVRVVGRQALQQRFTYLFSNGNVGVACQIYASGCLYADEVYFNGLLLELNAANNWPGGDPGHSTGKNNGMFYFGLLKSDTQAEHPQLIRCNNAIRADVVFDTGILSGGDTFKLPFLQIKTGTVVTCRNYRMLGGGGTIEGDGGTVILQSCRRMSRTGTFADDIRGNVQLVQRDCLDYDGIPFPGDLPGPTPPPGVTQEQMDNAIAEAINKLRIVSE